MAQTSYGSITVTDTTDITDVYLEYCMAEAGLTASQVESKFTWTSPECGWNTTYPTWQSGYEIWIRQVQIKEGINTGIYTLQTSATVTSNAILRVHGYDSSGQWLRQLFSITITSSSTLPIIQTFELPSDIKFIRISYPLTGLTNTGVFKGETAGTGTGLINENTNESGSIPANGTPASNSSFNRTQLIAVYPQGYGTPYLDTAVNDINIAIDDINITLEEFKYQTGTDIAPIFGIYEQKTISSVVEGQLDKNNNDAKQKGRAEIPSSHISDIITSFPIFSLVYGELVAPFAPAKVLLFFGKSKCFLREKQTCVHFSWLYGKKSVTLQPFLIT